MAIRLSPHLLRQLSAARALDCDHFSVVQAQKAQHSAVRTSARFVGPARLDGSLVGSKDLDPSEPRVGAEHSSMCSRPRICTDYRVFAVR